MRLGSTYSDSATHFIGKATAKTTYLYSKNGEVKLEGILADGRHTEGWVRSERLVKSLPHPRPGPTETKG